MEIVVNARRALMRRLDLRSESGFTLIELLVATVCGLIVSTATLAIVISSVHLTSNFSDRVDATQEGRTAMQKITQALASSCVVAALPPILPNTVDTANTISATSNATNLWFYSSLTDGANITPNLVDVTLTAGGSLVMNTYAYASTTGSAPNWVFSSTPTAFTLLPNATTTPGTTYVFQYYGYSGGALTANLNPSNVAISSTTASQVAEVVISFQALPSDNYAAQGRPASFSDSVVLRLTPASSSSTSPCV
jgi:prepilin-type N-terminal cleavage/methylation domain-containing protein